MSATIEVPASYSSLSFKDITVSHVPADSPTATKVLILAFNRPDKHNAVTENLLTELETAYRIIDQDERVRAVVLTGTGKAFCAGADLQIGFSGLMAHKASEESIARYRDQGGQVALAIANCTKPTIVAMNGPAAGFGLTITFPATIRVAWSGAKVALPFARLGLSLESCSAYFLPRLVGLAKAMHIVTTGDTYVASDPLVSPLFSKLLPTPQETVAYAVELASNIGENTSLTSTKFMRDMLLYNSDTPEEMHKLDSKVFISLVGSQDNVAASCICDCTPSLFVNMADTMSNMSSFVWSSMASFLSWRTLAYVFMLTNLKSLHFMWFARFLRAFVRRLTDSAPEKHLSPRCIFLPAISATRSPALECDYNLHKSNSTYFTDMDMSRGNFSLVLFGRAFNPLPGPTHFTMILGGTTCTWRKEIKPYARYELWTRVLSWDEKWLYVVTHFVKSGVFHPTEFVMQPYKKSKTAKGQEKEDVDTLKSVYASSVARYVFKNNRRTIPPEEALRKSNLLPNDEASLADIEKKRASSLAVFHS
ncbi:ClpP/crotonase-like domain-containing protein [Fusarium redolens]|uniref:ClpP/crotonase-like domain-containing protein n=1 Tax=Fusarium redolens TaxID=48865 RepID=A0A9P9FXT7_FUSRE|nr:ClpP/crotonase-like domain-containing protein [Fusarium redolens]KAH7203122.1 ClpP/crotonase-like domain-containing protein [Fusarium redolens]